MKTREDCLKEAKAKHPNASPADLSKMADAMMKEENGAEYSNTIKDVEIFGVGTHNGDKYSEADLDKMVTAFGELDYRPAIKIGHTRDKPGAPAYGWVQNLRRAGSKLIADFTDMHDSVVDAVRKKLYDNVSAEIYFNLKRGGKSFDRALKAVALLGAEVPAVANLVPLHKMEFAANGEFEKLFTSEMKLDVSPQSLFDCLSERMATIIQSFSEEGTDMKTKAEQMKELNEKLADVTAKLAALGSASDKDKDVQVKELSAKVKEISDQIKTLSETSDDDVTARERNAAKVREEQAQKDLKAAQDQIAELQADGRRRSVAEKVAALKVPAFRPIMEAMYTYALTHNAEKVKVYSKDKDGKDMTADKTLVDIADEFVSQINSQASKLFKALAQSGSPVREEGNDLDSGGDAGTEIDKQTKAWMRDKKIASYTEALLQVQEANPELAKRYSEQTAERANRHSH